MESGNRHPPNWVSIVYRALAAGRYAIIWLPELLRLYGMIVEEDGADKAKDWLLKELALSVKPSLLLTFFKLIRLAQRWWRAS
jgi:hypothetical protein